MLAPLSSAHFKVLSLGNSLSFSFFEARKMQCFTEGLSHKICWEQLEDLSAI